MPEWDIAVIGRWPFEEGNEERINNQWVYPKNATDKGMFETIAGGSNAGMPTWHGQAAGNPELLKTDEILRIIGWLRSMYAGGGDKPWLNEK